MTFREGTKEKALWWSELYHYFLAILPTRWLSISNCYFILEFDRTSDYALYALSDYDRIVVNTTRTTEFEIELNLVTFISIFHLNKK